MNVHDGHRKRLRTQYIDNGLDGFTDISALELLLFYAIPRVDTNCLAHELINKFGSLDEVLSASVRELTEVPGIGESTAALLTLSNQLIRKAKISIAKKEQFINSTREAVEYLTPFFLNKKVEVFYLVCLSSQNRIICCSELGSGVVNAVEISIRRIIETALKNRASSVLLAHNHPDGLPIPSKEDECFTQLATSALKAVSIHVEDHIIISGDSFISFARYGMLR